MNMTQYYVFKLSLIHTTSYKRIALLFHINTSQDNVRLSLVLKAGEQCVFHQGLAQRCITR